VVGYKKANSMKKGLLYCQDCGWKGLKRNLKPIINKRGEKRMIFTCPRCGGKLEKEYK
jgi:predicted RNA-binding Zn-ribbon protein involved in translation (DUF1610 family)